MHATLLSDILIIFALSVAVVFICERLHVPSLVGFFLTGIVAGPHALGLVSDVARVESISEVGIVALLFTVGLSFSLEHALRVRRTVLVGGTIQIVATGAAGYLAARALGQPPPVAVLAGFLLSLSSTAIAIKSLQDRAEADSLHGRIVIGILVFQDIITVPMLFSLPLLAEATAQSAGSLLTMAAQGLGVIAIVIVSARWVVPYVLYQIARTRSGELFLFAVVVICLAITWLTYSIGLAPALGAFLAGIIISESEYSQQALGDVIPFRVIFSNLFFVSVGMLLDIGFLFDHAIAVAAMACGSIIIKVLLAGAATALLGYSLRTTIGVALGLGQIGEFSFILAASGLQFGLLEPSGYQYFLTVSVITMAATPFLIQAAPHIADQLLRLPLPKRVRAGSFAREDDGNAGLTDHLIIIGYGVNGRNVASAAAEALIPYVIIEMNPETVRRERANGESILFGDGSQPVVLEHAGILQARVLVVATPDATGTRRIVENARRMNPSVYIIARTRFVTEVAPLYKLGADEVIPEEFETSVEIFSRVLRKYLIPREQIENFIRTIRAGGYDMFRSFSGDFTALSEIQTSLRDVEVSTFPVDEGCRMAGQTLAELGLRSRTGITILGIRRGDKTIPNPGGEETIHAGDVLLVMGPPDAVASVSDLLKSECAIL
ncbi:MAG TPA: cation:proton antiporter [Candidatus Latescibacteria bacterium]|nr:cation:proton antiporter [Candidatus Latescibacterota bacterium]HRU24381.1 cation:proton antiporter [Candidatus Latescibacterota bacterium]